MKIVQKYFLFQALAVNESYVRRCDDYRFFTDVEIPHDRHFVKASNYSQYGVQ